MGKRSLSKEHRVKTKRRLIRGKRTKVKEPSIVLCNKTTSVARTNVIEDEMSEQGKAGKIINGGVIKRQGFTKNEVWQIWKEELLRRFKRGEKCGVWDHDLREYYVYPKKLLEIANSINRNFNEDFWINEDLRSLIHKECFRFYEN